MTSWRRSPRSFDAEPSTPSPTGTEACRISATGAMPAPRRMLEVGQCATPVPAEPKRLTSSPERWTQCAHQTSSSSQPDLLEVLDRAAAEETLAVLLLLDGLGEMGVEAQPEAPRELGGLAHQPLRDRERRAGRDDDLRPRARAGLVEGEKALRVGEHLVGVLDEVVGRQAAVGLADVHRAARGDEPDAELARSLDLRLDEPFLSAREDVVVVEGGRAAAEGEQARPVRAAAYSASRSTRLQSG